MDVDGSIEHGDMQVPSIFPTDRDEQISRENHEISRQTDTRKNDEVEDESSIVVVEHDTAPTRNIARPLPPIPALERIARAEDTPVVLRNRNRPPSRSSVRRIRFVDAKHVPPPKPKVPRDIDGNVDERNIVRGKRDRKQTPANTSTHAYRLAVAEDDDTQFVSQRDTNDGLRYEDVCLFTRVLRKPEKQLRVIPQVVEARQKEIQGLYDARCLEWATWQDAERDRVKPNRTGFVDATKEDEATGRKTMGDDGTFPPSIAYDDRKNNTKSCSSDLRTDRGFENAKPSTTPCNEQEPHPADPDASIRQWPLRKLAGCAYTCTEH
eukprot:g82219.t1